MEYDGLYFEIFDVQQVEGLVRKVRETPEEAKEALRQIAQTYDLKDLVKRPLLLGMVLTTLDRLDPAAAVGTADLYEAYLRRWLDQTRSGDPECFSDDQKIEFAEALADQLWRSGQTSCTWQELQASVRARLAQHLPDDVPPAAAFLEIQGGAFFVHEGEDCYRFAHKSFLEYFLARGLARTLLERPAEVLATRSLTQEVVAFVAEVLRQEGDPKRAKAVLVVRDFLVRGRLHHQIDDPELGRLATAAANALRLLLGLSRWSKDGESLIPERADLRVVHMIGEDLTGASLVRANLEGAKLSRSDLSDANLNEAVLNRAQLTGARLDWASLKKASAREADLTCAEAVGADFEEADLSGAILRFSVWVGGQWARTIVEQTDTFALVSIGGTCEPFKSSEITCPAARVTIAAGHYGGITSVSWSPDGEIYCECWPRHDHMCMASGSTYTARAPCSHPRIICRARGNWGSSGCVTWSPDGSCLAAAIKDSPIWFWSASTYAQLPLIHTSARVLAWSSDGACLASAGSYSLTVWNKTNDRSPLRLIEDDDAKIGALA